MTILKRVVMNSGKSMSEKSERGEVQAELDKSHPEGGNFSSS